MNDAGPPSPGGGTWWTRPCGGRDVWWIALPLIVSTGSWSLMHFIDRVFLLWYSPDAMAAALPSGALHFLLLSIPLGTATYVNTFVAQYYGAGCPKRVGAALGQGLRIGFFATPLYLGLIPIAAWLFRVVGHDTHLADLEAIYFRVVAWGAGATIMSGALESYFTGRGRTYPVMLVNVAALGVDIVLDYLMIFGRGGFPEMGLAGAGWATVGSQWFRVVAYLIWMRLEASDWRRYAVWRGLLHYDRRLFARVVRFGGPSGMQLFVEMAGFTLLVLLMGRLGKIEMAATTLAFTVNSLAFLPLIGLSIAVSTLVGQQITHSRPDLAARATWSGFAIATAYMSFMGLLYVSVPQWFLAAHAAGVAPDEAAQLEFAHLQSITIVLLRFVAVYSILDGANIIFVAAVKGAGDTRFVMVVSVVMSTLVIGVVWAGIEYWGFGLYACWTVMTVWICLLGIIFWFRFYQGHWRSMRVIEADHGDQQAVGSFETGVAERTQY